MHVVPKVKCFAIYDVAINIDVHSKLLTEIVLGARLQCTTSPSLTDLAPFRKGVGAYLGYTTDHEFNYMILGPNTHGVSGHQPCKRPPPLPPCGTIQFIPILCKCTQPENVTIKQAP